jgi:hypothetical protein
MRRKMIDRCCVISAVITSAFFLVSYTLMVMIMEYNDKIGKDDE